MLVATHMVKFNRKWYRAGESFPANISAAEKKMLLSEGLAEERVTPEQARAASEVAAKLAALREKVAEAEARLAEVDAEIEAVKPIATDLNNRKAAAKKDKSEAAQSAVAEAEEAVKALDKLSKEKAELSESLKVNRAALEAFS